jgi:monovalent cation:H+ antiporter, CPA1 family
VGYTGSKITQTIDDPQIEITLTTIIAYGSYLLASHLHWSGVIATASAGLIVGNFGTKKDMSDQTRTALESFWEYIAFVMNSLVFLLIGLEVHVDTLAHAWRPIFFAIAAVLIGRSLSVYLLVPVTNIFVENIPVRWQHVMVWGGLRGALALALALSLDNIFPYRDRILDLTFGVVVFSILLQGLTVKPLLRVLGLADGRA